MVSIYGFFSTEDEDVTKEKNIMKTLPEWRNDTWGQLEFRERKESKIKSSEWGGGGGEVEEARGEHKYNTCVLLFEFCQQSEDRIEYNTIL